MWQQRIYSFLLRKILGPYLTTSSQKRLHQSLSISFKEGRLELLNVELDGHVITQKLQGVLNVDTSGESGDTDGDTDGVGNNNSDTDGDAENSDNKNNNESSNPSSSSSSCKSSNHPPCQVKNVKVEKLLVTLSLVYESCPTSTTTTTADTNDVRVEQKEQVEEQEFGDTTFATYTSAAATSSSSSNTTKGGTNGMNGKKARLVARVELDGVIVEIEPFSTNSTSSNEGNTESNTDSSSTSISKKKEVTNTNSTTTTSTSSKKRSGGMSLIQSYVQAAMDSLRLSLHITNLSVSVATSTTTTTNTTGTPPPHHGTSTPPMDIPIMDRPNDSRDDTNYIMLNIESISYQDCAEITHPSTYATPSSSHAFTDSSVPYSTGGTSNTAQRNVIFGKNVCINCIQMYMGRRYTASTTTSNTTSLNNTIPMKLLKNQKEGGGDNNTIKDESNVLTINGQIKLQYRVISTTASSSTNPSLSKTSTSTTTTTTTTTSVPKLSRVVEMTINDTLDFEFKGWTHFHQLHDLITSFTEAVENHPSTNGVDEGISPTTRSNDIGTPQLVGEGGRQQYGPNALQDIDEEQDLEDDDDDDMGLLSNILMHQSEDFIPSGVDTTTSTNSTSNAATAPGAAIATKDGSISTTRTTPPLFSPPPPPPSNKGRQQVDTSSIDEFFDTNDKGLSYYQSVMVDSIHSTNDDDNDGGDDQDTALTSSALKMIYPFFPFL